MNHVNYFKYIFRNDSQIERKKCRRFPLYPLMRLRNLSGLRLVLPRFRVSGLTKVRIYATLFGRAKFKSDGKSKTFLSSYFLHIIFVFLALTRTHGQRHAGGERESDTLRIRSVSLIEKGTKCVGS